MTGREPGLISVLCPTRNRPDNVRRLLGSADVTVTGRVETVFYTDEDAPLPGELRNRPGVTEVNGPRITLSQTWNECYSASRGEIVMQCGDDIVFRTHAWDEKVRAKFRESPDKILLVYGDDGYQHAGLATHGFVHCRWVDAVGYFTPPHFSCDYGDQWLFDVAGMIGRRLYLPDVVTEHMHPVAGKGEWDQTHAERLARGNQDNVARLYAATLPERAKAAETLRELLHA